MNDSMADVLTGFDCIADQHAEILILGSMPGVASLRQQQYYAHPRNAFWKIMEALYGIPAELDYQQRLMLLKEQKIALWDVAHQCVRAGSLDSNIKAASVQVNDFNALFSYSEKIKRVYLNGGKAAELFTKKVVTMPYMASLDLQCTQLPSTSPANARLSLEQKIAIWQQIKA